MISVLSAGWLDKKRSEVKESTIIKYECIVTRHINPALGDCTPDRLTAGRIDEFSRGLLKSGLSAKTVHDILVVLRGVLVYAAAIAGNGSAVPRIRYPARERKEMRVLTREELCDRMRHENGAAYILTGSERCMEPRTLQYRMKKYARDCGLDGVHFHTLRYTFATRAVEAGFEIKSLSEILGHSTTTITLDRYVHSSLEFKRENMRKLSEIGM